MSTAVQIKEECWGKRSFPSIQQATKWIQERPVKVCVHGLLARSNKPRKHLDGAKEEDIYCMLMLKANASVYLTMLFSPRSKFAFKFGHQFRQPNLSLYLTISIRDLFHPKREDGKTTMVFPSGPRLALPALSSGLRIHPAATGEDHRNSPHQVFVPPTTVAADHMRVSWITDDRHVPSLVEYGKVSGKYDSAATGEHTSYIYFFYTSGKIHHVKIGPLEPDTVYYYRCGGIDQEFSFKTPPAALPIEIATEWTASTLAHVAESNYDMLLLPGDLSYADTQQPLWDSFGRFVQPYASKRPWMVTEGNHDIEAFPVFHCHPFVAYDSRWRMPYDESGSASNLYYSFDVAGAVHVVMLGSYADFNTSSSQYKWLVADLAKVDRRITPWLVALLHAPWYNTNLAHQGEGESMRQAMESLLYRARVDVVFAGHVHAYERFQNESELTALVQTRAYDNKANPCGPAYITIGDGGNREGLALQFDKHHKSAPLSLFREASFGHGRLKVVNGTHAHWSWHRNDEDDGSTVGDEVWVESLSASAACGVPSASTKVEL
ncbi:Calcineurin-like phosphoesterase [Musa troglodytarum]|uniref:Purple acid phosphatase n=1 Tax=Musa troglodytarum TaxID=320322 RepID=A0A9E7ENJ0_9LILI|nr:Calcineurin-like phosphoesterase [Musa troglodytarum]